MLEEKDEYAVYSRLIDIEEMSTQLRCWIDQEEHKPKRGQKPGETEDAEVLEQLKGALLLVESGRRAYINKYITPTLGH